MKPKVTFFGESLSTEVRDRSLKMIEDADQLLVIGSSLATYSAFRLCRGMKEKEIDGQSVGKVRVSSSCGRKEKLTCSSHRWEY